MALEDLTHDDLDAVADGAAVEDYPSSGNKDEKVAALEAAGVPDDATPEDYATPVEQSGIDPALREARESTREAEAAAASDPLDAPEHTPVVDPDGRLAKAKADARKIEAGERDTREGPAEV